MKKIVNLVSLLLILPLTGSLALSQNADVPLNSELYHFIDRLDITGATGKTIHTDIKPYSRSSVTEIFQTTDTSSFSKRENAWFNLMRNLGDDVYANEQNGKGILKQFYPNKRDLGRVKTENFTMYFNPVAYLTSGISKVDSLGKSENLIQWRNTRGIQVRGSVLDKVGFFTELSDNQVRYPRFIRNSFDQSGVLMGEGHVKSFKENGYDYFAAKGYVTFSPVKQFRVKLGRDRAFWGNGYQSLVLSDNATDYFFLNLNTKIWKLEYTNHFAKLVDYVRNKPDNFGIFPSKYAVMHQISFKPTHTLSFSIFESVVYSPSLPGGQRGFEIEYLNPIIFYRSVEQMLGGPDNSMLGVSGKGNFLKRFQLYGQVLLDDFNFGLRDQGTGYWGNKFGLQGGLKYINAFFVNGLDIQLEANRIRPFTYSHFNPAANNSHYGQPLAHSMGANLFDYNLMVRYQPIPRIQATLIASKLSKGLDVNGGNFGGDIFRSYIYRDHEFDNTTGQGTPLNVTTIAGKLSYQILSMDAFAEIEARYRKENSSFSEMTITASLRWNIAYKPVKF